MSMVDLPAPIPHRASGYTLSASDCNIVSATRAKTFPTILRREIPSYLLQSLRSTVCLHCDDIRVAYILVYLPFIPALQEYFMEMVCQC